MLEFFVLSKFESWPVLKLLVNDPNFCCRGAIPDLGLLPSASANPPSWFVDEYCCRISESLPTNCFWGDVPSYIPLLPVLSVSTHQNTYASSWFHSQISVQSIYASLVPIGLAKEFDQRIIRLTC